MLIFLCYLIILHSIHYMPCLAKQVSSIYIFGDSIVDNGRKSSHESGMKAGYPPYGDNCMIKDKYRFTNGLTIPEIMALSLNLDWPKSLDEVEAYQGDKGVNYASASAGILPETGKALGNNYCLENQINFFRNTVEKFLRQKFQSAELLSNYLASSIYLINIGSSDYIHNYLQPEHYNSSRQYNEKDFANLLIEKLEFQLKDLYNLGARKILIFEIGPLGCLPYIVNRVKPRSRCVERINKLVSIFNNQLNVMLKELNDKLQGSTFMIAKTFQLIKQMIKNPIDYGLEDTRWPCCPTQKNGTGLCEKIVIRVLSDAEMEKLPPDPFGATYFYRSYFCDEDFDPSKRSTEGIGKPRQKLCLDRRLYLFYDELHLTEIAYKIIVNKCLASTDGICFPSHILPDLREPDLQEPDI